MRMCFKRILSIKKEKLKLNITLNEAIYGKTNTEDVNEKLKNKTYIL